MAKTKLPLGLIRYAGNTFEKLHGPGCMCLTASSVPDLFGLGRNGRLALAGHVMGLYGIEGAETDLTRRGKKFQRPVAEIYEEDHGVRTRLIHAWAKHPDMPFYASPDVLTFPHVDVLPGEIKNVAKQVYDEQWLAGPPQKVLLQHQAQLKLTGAKVGPVIASAISDFVFDVEHWDVEAHAETQDIIVSEVHEFLELCKAGQLPPPDLSSAQDQEAVIRLANITEGMKVDLPDELLFHVRRYQRAGVIEKRCEKRRTEAKAHLIDALGGAQLGVFKGGETVKVMRIDYQEQLRKPYSATRINIGQQKEEPKRKRQASPTGLIRGEHAMDAAMWEETVADSQNGF